TARLAAHLFAPEVATRLRPHGDPGERFPPEEPAGENRPVGAYIDYFIGATNAGAHLALEIRDAAGSVVRRYANDQRALPVNADALNFPAFWTSSVAPPSSAPGMHRYLWDLAYAQPAMLGDPPFAPGGADGVTAPPGKYTVRMTVGGASFVQPLTVIEDPRVKVSTADLLGQFRLARDIESLRVRVAQATLRART